MKSLHLVSVILLWAILILAGCSSPTSSSTSSSSTDYSDGSKTLTFASTDWKVDDIAKYYYFENLPGSTTNGTVNYNANITVTWAGEGGSSSDSDGVVDLAVKWENATGTKNVKVELGASAFQYILSGGTANGIDATNCVYTVRVYVPSAIKTDGNMGLKLFMKDTAGKGQYGPWVSLGSLTEGWNTVTWNIASDTPNWTDSGYDKTKAKSFGIAFDQNGATITSSSGDLKIDWMNVSGYTINP